MINKGYSYLRSTYTLNNKSKKKKSQLNAILIVIYDYDGVMLKESGLN